MDMRLHKREEHEVRRAGCISGKVVSLQGWHGQCPAARAASCTRFARVQSLAPCNRTSVWLCLGEIWGNPLGLGGTWVVQT